MDNSDYKFISVDGAYRNTCFAIFDVVKGVIQNVSFNMIHLTNPLKYGLQMNEDLLALQDFYIKGESVYHPLFWVYEMPKGSLSAKGNMALTLSYATFINNVPTHKIRFIQNNVRKGLAGTNDKKDIIDYVRANYPQVPLHKTIKVAEHQADAFVNGLMYSGLNIWT